MSWNILAEFVSLVFLIILIQYANDYRASNSLKNKLYIFNLWFVLGQIILSILSILGIQYYSQTPLLLNHVIQVLYFLSVPLIPTFIFLYVISVIWERLPKLNSFMKLMILPNILYFLYVLTNPLTNLIYTFNENGEFILGEGVIYIYLFSNIYILSIIAAIFIGRKRINKDIKRVLLVFPIVIVAAQFVQLLYPHVILTGAAATTALLIVYLFFQNNLMYIDPLTGVKNRKAFTKDINMHIMNKNQLEVILISMDDFKDVNDNYGHIIGDTILKLISETLVKIAHYCEVYRFSGDEFVVIIVKDSENNIKEEILQIFEKRITIDNNQLDLSASFSCVNFPEHAATLIEIVQVLEYGIKQSKGQGKGKMIESSASTVESILRKNKIKDFIKKASLEHNFNVQFQPIYALNKDKFTAAEALLRLKSDDFGAISPLEFIPIAEEVGLMQQLNYFVIENVCKFINNLKTRDVDFEFISLNMSYSQIMDKALISKLNALLLHYGVESRHIHIEITESMFIDQIEVANEILEKLVAEGYKLCLDDFGTGYSNITNVISFPVSIIKLDKSMVHKSLMVEKNLVVTQGISKSFNNVGFEILTEGIETKEHLEIAKQFLSNYIQGYFFARPMPYEEAIKYIGKSKLI